MSGQTETSAVTAGAVGQTRSKRARVTVGTSVVTVTPPNGAWNYLKISNRTLDTWVAVGINEDPSNEGADPPTQSSHWGVGYDVLGGASELVPIVPGGVVTVRLLASAAATAVTLNFCR